MFIPAMLKKNEQFAAKAHYVEFKNKKVMETPKTKKKK